MTGVQTCALPISEEEGRPAQQIKAKKSSTKQVGETIGSLLGNKDVQSSLGSLGDILSVGGM